MLQSTTYINQVLLLLLVVYQFVGRLVRPDITVIEKIAQYYFFLVLHDVGVGHKFMGLLSNHLLSIVGTVHH